MSACTGGKSLQRCGDVLRSNLRKMGRLLKRKTRKFIHIVAVLRGCLFKKTKKTRQKIEKSTKYLTENLSSEQKGERKDEKSNVKSANGRKNRKRNY